MTLTTGRCVPRRGRSRPRPPTILASSPAGVASASAIGAAAAAVVARLTAATPTGPAPQSTSTDGPGAGQSWLAGEYLALLEAQGRGVGVIYLLHFDRPIGDTSNPRGFAAHYTGWTLDLPARLTAHAAGRGLVSISRQVPPMRMVTRNGGTSRSLRICSRDRMS